MKTQDIALIGCVAVATATLTVAVFLPNSLDAGNDLQPGKINHPKLVSGGVELALTAAGHRTFTAGEEPVFELQAVNTTDQNAEVTVRVAMNASAPSSPLSRMVAVPQTLWQQSCPLTLKPHETKTVPLATATRLPANRTIYVTLRTGDAPSTPVALSPNGSALVSGSIQQTIVALDYSTVVPQPKAGAGLLN
jgi:hypothetical protein